MRLPLEQNTTLSLPFDSMNNSKLPLRQQAGLPHLAMTKPPAHSLGAWLSCRHVKPIKTMQTVILSKEIPPNWWLPAYHTFYQNESERGLLSGSTFVTSTESLAGERTAYSKSHPAAAAACFPLAPTATTAPT